MNFEAMLPLSKKTIALLMELPPSLQIKEGLEQLGELVPQLDNRFRYACALASIFLAYTKIR